MPKHSPWPKKTWGGGTAERSFHNTKTYFRATVHPLTGWALPLENSWLRPCQNAVETDERTKTRSKRVHLVLEWSVKTEKRFSTCPKSFILFQVEFTLWK